MAPTPEQVFALVAGRPGSVWLDGGDTGWSILAWGPSEVRTRVDDWPDMGRSMMRPATHEGEVPFAGGVLGFLGFGAGRVVAPVPASGACPEPHLWLGRYSGGLCFDHDRRRWHIGGTGEFAQQAAALLRDAAPLEDVPPAPSGELRTMSAEAHAERVARILEWIAAGDCYQVNLTRAVHLDRAGDPWPAYRRIRRAGLAPYGAFLRLDERIAVLSNSPELFLQVGQGQVRSRPIKGTRPRAAEPLADQALASDLMHSPKEQAELTMIVDLVRNDLGRVAVPGSVHTSRRQIDSWPNVHHAWQEVVATLESAFDGWDALAAAFPPGSVTGAPKARACQRIAELEPEPRGVYCGAVGFMDDRGHGTWNVAIRTAVFEGNQARYHVGGGIVAASDPSAEFAETTAKGRVLRKALIAPRSS